MSKHVRFTRLIERTNDQGETYLSGWFGHAKVIGKRGNPGPEGAPSWVIYLAEPDQRADQSRERARHRRKAGGCDAL